MERIPVNPSKGVFWELLEKLPKKVRGEKLCLRVRVRVLKLDRGGKLVPLSTALVPAHEVVRLAEIAGERHAA